MEQHADEDWMDTVDQSRLVRINRPWLSGSSERKRDSSLGGLLHTWSSLERKKERRTSVDHDGPQCCSLLRLPMADSGRSDRNEKWYSWEYSPVAVEEVWKQRMENSLERRALVVLRVFVRWSTRERNDWISWNSYQSRQSNPVCRTPSSRVAVDVAVDQKYAFDSNQCKDPRRATGNPEEDERTGIWMVGWIERMSRMVRFAPAVAVDFGRVDGRGIPSNRSFTGRSKFTTILVEVQLTMYRDSIGHIGTGGRSFILVDVIYCGSTEI